MNLTHLPVTVFAFALVILMISDRTEAEEPASVNNVAAKNSPDDQPLPDLPLAITSFGADRAGDAIYVYGGHHGEAHHYSTAGQSGDLLRLDLANPKSWEVVATGPKLQGLALVAHGGKLYRLGGFQARNAEGEEHDLWSVVGCACFDPATKKWTALPDMPTPRSSFDAVVVGDSIYVVGGWAMQGDQETAWCKDAYRLNLAEEKPQWKAMPAPPFQRRALCVGARGDQIYVIGGMQPDGKVTTKTAIYDLGKNTWSDGPDLPGEGMEGFGAACCNINDDLYVSTSSGKLLKLAADAQSWQAVGQLRSGRFFHQMLPLGKAQLAAIAGAHMEQGRFKDVERLPLAE